MRVHSPPQKCGGMLWQKHCAQLFGFAILLSVFWSPPLIVGQSVVISEGTRNNLHDTLYLCMITSEDADADDNADAASIRCGSASLDPIDPTAPHTASAA